MSLVLLACAVGLVAAAGPATLVRPRGVCPGSASDHALFRPGVDDERCPRHSLLDSPNSLSKRHAVLLPIIGAITLCTLYLIFKYFDPLIIAKILYVYFSVMAAGVMPSVFMYLIDELVWTTCKKQLPTMRLKVPKALAGSELDAKASKSSNADMESASSRDKRVMTESPSRKESWITLSYSVIPAILIASIVYLGRFVGTKEPWYLINIMALCFAFSAIRMINIDSFKTGVIMLSGLFLYDIYFVFATKFMVTVAVGLVESSAPVALTVPASGDNNKDSHLLGLGDVIVPGLFLALCLRFDQANFYRYNSDLSYISSRSYPKPYFQSGIFAYTLSLIMTVAVMTYFKAPQPALLYISPALILALVITGYIRDEIKDIWNYMEEENQDEFSDLQDSDDNSNKSKNS